MVDKIYRECPECEYEKMDEVFDYGSGTSFCECPKCGHIMVVPDEDNEGYEHDKGTVKEIENNVSVFAPVFTEHEKELISGIISFTIDEINDESGTGDNPQLLNDYTKILIKLNVKPKKQKANLQNETPKNPYVNIQKSFTTEP